MSYSRLMLLSKEIQQWTHLFRMCLPGSNTYNYNVPVPSEIISLVKLSTPCFKRRELLFMGTTEDVLMLASNTQYCRWTCHLKPNGNIIMIYILVHLRFRGSEWVMALTAQPLNSPGTGEQE